MADDAKALIELATRRFVGEVPALEPIKLVVGVELQGQGRRAALPPRDARREGHQGSGRGRARARRHAARVLQRDGARSARSPDWIEAFIYGQAKASRARAVHPPDRQRRRAPAGARAHAQGATSRRRSAVARTRAAFARRAGALVVGRQLLRRGTRASRAGTDTSRSARSFRSWPSPIKHSRHARPAVSREYGSPRRRA